MNKLPPSPFLTDHDNRFVPNEAALLEAIDPPPAFISDPSPEYLQAIDLMPILKILAEHAK